MKIWDALGVAFEGTANVRQAKIRLLVLEYEMFKMKENESIDDIFGRFQTILNGLRNLDKKYDNIDPITKILRCLSKRWRPKVTAIQEEKYLSTLKIEDLLGYLDVHEIELAKDQEGSKKQKTVTFKAKSFKALKTEASSNELETTKRSMSSIRLHQPPTKNPSSVMNVES